MSFTSSIGSEAASRLMTVIAVGALTTAGAGVGTAVVLTGSTSPSAWLAAYQHSRECAQEGAAQDANCSSAAAQALAATELAQKLEQEAQQLKPTPSPASDPSPAPLPPGPVAAPAPTSAPPARSDDSGDGSDG